MQRRLTIDPEAHADCRGVIAAGRPDQADVRDGAAHPRGLRHASVRADSCVSMGIRGAGTVARRLHDGGPLADRATATARGLCLGNAAPFALGDEVPALLDLAQDAVALDGLPEPRDQVLG